MSTTIERWERADIFEHECFSEKKSQAEMILEYLQNYGEITAIEALTAIGCFRLAARISDLRADGYNITTDMTRDGKQSYANYKVKEEENENCTKEES